MDKRKIKYFYFDMDGTLLDDNKQLATKNLKAIKQLQELGYKVGVISGRPDYMLQQELDLMQPNLPVIAINGAKIIDHNQLLQLQFLDDEDYQKIYHFLIKHRMTFLGYKQDSMHYYLPAHKFSPWIDWLQHTIMDRSFKHRWKLIPIVSHNDRFCKLLVITAESSLATQTQLLDLTKTCQHSYAIKSQPKVLDIMPRGTSKGQALKVLASKNIIDLQATIVFGDADNDVSMFKQAAMSVAMANASAYVKSQASLVSTFSNNEAGIAKFIKKNFLTWII